MKLKLGMNDAAPLAAALIYLIAQGACAQPSMPAQANSPALTVATTTSLTGTEEADVLMNQAAAAARRDQDPQINGSIRDVHGDKPRTGDAKF